jgi:hypothetical protein
MKGDRRMGSTMSKVHDRLRRGIVGFNANEFQSHQEFEDVSEYLRRLERDGRIEILDEITESQSGTHRLACVVIKIADRDWLRSLPKD